MKKALILIIVFFLPVILLCIYENAFSIECSDCHTMHNSQDGVSLFGSPNNNLLSSGCVGCHTSPGDQISSNTAPAILHTNEPSGQGAGKTLASGDFFWVNSDEVTNTAKGHNVLDLAGITGKDANMSNLNPPGWDATATGGSFSFGQVAGGEAVWSSQLTCAGKYGCHGDHNEIGSFKGIRGAHHNNIDGAKTQATLADTIGNSYRFLGGIKGLENVNWNWNETSSIHNEYYGTNNTADRTAGGLASYGSRDTISFLCSQCHGLYHGTIKSGPLWIRHPTDITLPASGEYALYNTADDTSIGSYNLDAPVARNNVPSLSNATINAGTDIVMCLSCHRAHGSDQDDLLRWNYSTMISDGSNKGGCFVCHTTKNAPEVNL